jgi:hypothetical protein
MYPVFEHAKRQPGVGYVYQLLRVVAAGQTINGGRYDPSAAIYSITVINVRFTGAARYLLKLWLLISTLRDIRLLNKMSVSSMLYIFLGRVASWSSRPIKVNQSTVFYKYYRRGACRITTSLLLISSRSRGRAIEANGISPNLISYVMAEACSSL